MICVFKNFQEFSKLNLYLRNTKLTKTKRSMETNSDTPINSRVTPVRASIDEITKTTKETLSPFRPSLSSA